MTTWANLDLAAQRLLDDTGESLHALTDIRTYLGDAQLFVTMYLQAAGAEKTGDLFLTTAVPIYTIHSTFADFILPLRVRIAGRTLRPSSLAAVSRLHSNWYTQQGDPETFFMIGATLLGFHPVPNASVIAKTTYLGVPVTTDTSPPIDSDLHDILPLYASSLALAREGDMESAQLLFQRFVEAIGINKDPRFMPGAGQTNKKKADEPAKEQQD